MTDQSVSSLVERLKRQADQLDNVERAGMLFDDHHKLNRAADSMREAASRLSSEGMRAPKVPCDNCIVLQHCEHHKRCLAECTPRDLFTTSPAPVHICGDPNDACDHECADKFYEAQERRKSSPSSAPAATPRVSAATPAQKEKKRMSGTGPSCPKHGDPLICLACESDEDRIWDARGYVTQRFPKRPISAATPAPDFDVQVGKALQDAMDATKDMRATRASQAEAALKEMQKRLETQARMTIAQCELAEERFVLMDEFEAWLRDFAEKGLSPHVTSVLAELQRRRSAPGQEKA